MRPKVVFGGRARWRELFMKLLSQSLLTRWREESSTVQARMEQYFMHATKKVGEIFSRAEKGETA